MPRFNRVYYHYELLEEYTHGMWRIERGVDRKAYVEEAAMLMRDPERFEAAMMRAINEWPVSCEHSLTAEDTNRIAWLGHAGCCIEVGSPEEATRAGWHTLTKPEQDEANAAAARALSEWESIYEAVQQFTLFAWADAQTTNRN